MATLHPILRQHFDTSDIAFAKIDHEIAILRESIRALHAFRNTFTSIYRLPPEILARIFLFGKDLPGLQVQRRIMIDGKVISPPFRWFVATGVSQHWRNVALGNPSLWACIDSSYPRHIIEELLLRSKSAPLSVDLSHSSSRDVHLIGTSLFRIRELKVVARAAAWNDLWSNLSSPAPLMEYLKVSTQEPSQPHSIISHGAFAGTTPCLRRLELIGCSIDITSFLLKDLTVLNLSYLWQKMSVADIFTVLRGLPRLTFLALTEVLHQNASEVSSNSGIITLSNLGSLTINGVSFSQDLNILSHLSIPANSTVHFCSNTRTEEGISALSNFLSIQNAARFPDPSPPLLKSLDLHILFCRLRLSIDARYAEGQEVTDLVTFQLYGHQWDGDFELPDNQEVVNLFSHLPLSSLISFATNLHIHVNTWANIFGSLPRLKHITASGIHAIDIFSAIIQDVDDGLRGGAQTASFPSNSQPVDFVPIFGQLETIEVVEMTFPESLKDLVNALHARRSVGRGIKSLQIVQCRNVDESTYEELSDSFDNVMWDEWAPSSEGGSDDHYDRDSDD
ncbi:hypothetical protein BDN72DRAFT_960626 [Pluteus cervinus]|uniref:Uncharacterized protein n=1 Tax=Pluteus cervinus TaxID=181527 RepID=A0ACD3AQF5_9AGAR|nr:hypothetical protein BDN72DRAFT_960626 [Pluteus cervinus]